MSDIEEQREYYERMMDEVGAEYRRRIAELQAENDKLREERDMYRDLVGMMDHPDLNAQLSAENDKLRDLVRELWNCALQYHRFDVYRHEIGVDGCGIGCTANGEGCCACKLEQRMRELGVEA